MTAPKMQPSGIINVTSTAQLQGKLELFGYGAHDGVINPGDLLILCTDYVGEGFHRQKVEFKLRLKGRDMYLFVEAANLANNLWAENEHGLNASVNTPNLDQRGKSEIRLGETLDLINKIYPKAN